MRLAVLPISECLQFTCVICDEEGLEVQSVVMDVGLGLEFRDGDGVEPQVGPGNRAGELDGAGLLEIALEGESQRRWAFCFDLADGFEDGCDGHEERFVDLRLRGVQVAQGSPEREVDVVDGCRGVRHEEGVSGEVQIGVQISEFERGCLCGGRQWHPEIGSSEDEAA